MDQEKSKEKRTEKEKEKEGDKAFVKIASTNNNTESLNAKHLDRQKHVEQVTITATSPVSPCQVITVTNSDHSSSPALSSSMSSQIISMENGQQTSGLPISSQPLITAPTIERLLPIGTIVRATGKQFILLIIQVIYYDMTNKNEKIFCHLNFSITLKYFKFQYYNSCNRQLLRYLFVLYFIYYILCTHVHFFYVIILHLHIHDTNNILCANALNV